MAKHESFILCMNEESAFYFAEPLEKIIGSIYRDYVNDLDLIFSVFVSRRYDSDLIFTKAVQGLIDSPSFDYMVYRVVNGHKENLADIETWSIEMEINEDVYEQLFTDLCQKARAYQQKKWRENK